MTQEIPKRFEPAAHQGRIFEHWLESGSFGATPDQRSERFVFMMPLPNVTGALHMGHAMDNVMQDLLVRWKRMQGANTLWMPGTDHAGIATQAVVEKRLLELEGKTRHDVGRSGLIERIWAWKDEFQARIIKQQQSMGCSCDWSRQRFTMDAMCTRAVRETFFRLFQDGLIYRGNRLVNWDCHLQTAVSDDEVYHETVDGHFWHVRYAVIHPEDGEPEDVVVATTRPETMLGDVGVAVHPDPKAELEHQLLAARERLARVPRKEQAAAAEDLRQLEERRISRLPHLLTLRRMAQDGRMLRLPLLDREIPLILDVWAKPGLGSGAVKLTPAHDANDYEVWLRNQDTLGIINILQPDGTLNTNAGPYAGLDRLEARKRVVQDLEDAGRLERTEERVIEIGHSDRSKTPVEPYLSRQWFVRMGDREGGVVLGRGTSKESHVEGLAQAAINAADPAWQSPTGLRFRFHPDGQRYRATYVNWLAEKRDWCISRQLWWGHRIPIWMADVDAPGLARTLAALEQSGSDWWHAWVADETGVDLDLARAQQAAREADPEARFELQVCIRHEEGAADHADLLANLGLEQDPDVLDTWFSSALWPHSTLGWPDPQTAAPDEGQPPCAGAPGRADTLSYYYPGSCLVTGRDIITLWVARMAIMGLYNLGDLPFSDVFLHANILDGKGERMSKSKGNGIDPLDIIERYGVDAMRYVLCDMQTGSQDIRLPVQAISPFTGELVDLAQARHGRSIFTYICPGSGKEFDVLGTMPDLPSARIISERFEAGRNFCNKLWNAVRFALLNVGELGYERLSLQQLQQEDRWILSRLACTIGEVQAQLEAYHPAAAIACAREFFWSELCDWYLELIKPRLKQAETAGVARQVLAFALDQVLRLLHPFIPFVTEVLWERLREQVSVRGLEQALPDSELLIRAAWPEVDLEARSPDLEAEFALMQRVVRAIRDIRSRYDVSPRMRLEVAVRGGSAALATLAGLSNQIQLMAGLDRLDLAPDLGRPPMCAVQTVGDLEVFVAGVVDQDKERARLEKQLQSLEQRAAASARKLDNESFTGRAPAEVVTRERKRLEELEAELGKIQGNLESLGSGSS